MYTAKAYSAASATSALAAATISRRDLTEHDVQIEILFCGICHSDLHQARNEWTSNSETENLGRIRVFGVYRDATAYIETPHFKKFRAATDEMVKSRPLIEAVPISLAAKEARG